MAKIRTHKLLNAVLVTGAGASASPLGMNKTFQLVGATSAGAGAASVTVEGSNDDTNWYVLDTLTLTLGTVVTSDEGVNTAAWKYIRGNVGSISGTDGYVTLVMANETD